MDEDIRAALTDIKTDLKGGFEKVDQTFKEMVTKGEFNATVQRIDAEQVGFRRDLDTHRDAISTGLAEVRSEMHLEFDKSRATARWAIGLSIPGAGLLIVLAQWLLSLAGN